MAADQSSSPFIKQLASSDRTIRDNALSAIRTYIHRPTLFSPLECLKLWKGLYYCMWMSDKPRNQQQLARDLASLLDAPSTRENTLNFFDAFWKTMAREWGSIDALRMDKYLYLVRCMLNKGFEKIKGDGTWGDEGLMGEYLRILEETPLEPVDHRIPNGVRFHVIDIYVDELDKVDTRRTVPLEVLLAPLKALRKKSPTKAVRERVKEALEDERLSDWKGEKKSEDIDGNEDQDEFGGFDD